MTLEEILDEKDYVSVEGLRDKSIRSHFYEPLRPSLFRLHDTSIEYLPLYLSNLGKVYNPPDDHNIERVSSMSPFTTTKFPMKYLPGFLQGAFRGLYTATIEGIGPVELGKFYIKDLTTKKILFLGVIKKKFLGIHEKTVTLEQVTVNSAINRKEYPIEFYVATELYVDPKYKKLLDQLSILINNVCKNPGFRIVLSGNIASEFFKGFSFPKFKTVKETESYLLKVLSKVVERYDYSLL